MERFIYRCVLIVLMLAPVAGIGIHAQLVEMGVIFDQRANALQAKKTGLILATEYMHNEEIARQKKTQDSIAAAAATMAVIKETWKMAMTNLKGLGGESKYYLSIGKAAAEIATYVPTVTNHVSNSKLPGKTIVLKEIGDLFARCISLVDDFTNICNNAQVDPPWKKPTTPGALDPGNNVIGQQTIYTGSITGSNNEKKDGANMLDRNKRIGLAASIYGDLLKIKYKLHKIDCIAKYSTISDVVRTYAPEDWCALVNGKADVNMLINDWNKLKR